MFCRVLLSAQCPWALRLQLCHPVTDELRRDVRTTPRSCDVGHINKYIYKRISFFFCLIPFFNMETLYHLCQRQKFYPNYFGRPLHRYFDNCYNYDYYYGFGWCVPCAIEYVCVLRRGRRVIDYWWLNEKKEVKSIIWSKALDGVHVNQLHLIPPPQCDYTLIYFINYYVIILYYCKHTNPGINLSVYPTYRIASLFKSFFNHAVIFVFVNRLYVLYRISDFYSLFQFLLCCYLLHWSENAIPTAIYQ